VGRHVSSERRRSLRSRFFFALLAIIVLLALAAFAAHEIWDRSQESPAPRRGPATTPSAPRPTPPKPTPTPPVTPTPTPTPGATVTPAGAITLALTVTGKSCAVFVGVPGGDILVDRSLVRGQSVRLDEQRLSVVLGDGSAVRVYVNGRLRPPGEPGRRVTFTALKG
jgi:hypothetical protein